MPLDVAFWPQPATNEKTCTSDLVNQLRKQLEKSYHRVEKNLGHALGHQKEVYYKKVHGDSFKASDIVFLHSMVLPRSFIGNFTGHGWDLTVSLRS